MIAIKGYSMPKDCINCVMQFGGWCGVSPPEIDERVAETVEDAINNGKPDWCPLVEIDAEPVNRAEILRLCNEIEDIVNEIAACAETIDYSTNGAGYLGVLWTKEQSKKWKAKRQRKTTLTRCLSRHCQCRYLGNKRGAKDDADM